MMIVVLLAGLSSFAKHDGRYLHDLTLDFKTEHLEWGKKLQGGKINALFILARKGGRDAVEIAQRMDIDLNAVNMHSSNKMSLENMYEGAVEGTSIHEKTQELLKKLDQHYDIFVIGNFAFDELPAEAKLKLLRQVMNGSGLMIVYPWPTKLKKIFSKPVAGAEQILALADSTGLPAKINSLDANTLLKTYQFGKGRVAVLDYRANHNAYHSGLALTAPNPYSNRWQAEYENNMALLLRAMVWTAGRQNAVSISCPELVKNSVLPQKAQIVKLNITSKENFAGKIKLRLRNEFNVIIDQQDKACSIVGAGVVDYSIPFLPAGKYYLDVMAKQQEITDNFGYFAFTVNSPVQPEIIAPEVISNRAPINAEVKLNGASAKNLSLEITLVDSPYGRIWHKQNISLDGKKDISLAIKDYCMPTIAGYLRCAVKQNDNVLAVAEKLLFFPDYRLEDYLEMAWETVPEEYLAKFYAEQEVDGLGWRAGLAHPTAGGANARTAALLNQRFVSYTTRIGIKAGKQGEVSQFIWFFLPKSEFAAQKALNGDESFNNPDVKRLWAAGIKHRIENLPNYGPAIYALGDENFFSYDAGFGKADENAFQEFLKNKYQDISALNREWETSYASFDQVKHLSQKESKDSKNFPAWFDHRQYMEKMYADIHHFCAQEIKKYDPNAKVGAEGSVPGDLEQTIKGLEFWGPYSDLVMDEVLRSIGGDKIRMLWWGSYVGSHGGRNQYPLPLWKDLLTGNVNGSAWFSSSAAGSESALGSDLSYAHYLRELKPYLDELRNGQAQLMINTPLENNGIAIFWSHASDSARLLDSRLINPRDSMGTFIRFCHANGLNFDFVTESTIDRLKHSKILFLFGASAISEQEKNAILNYVRDGGTVVSDLNPGLLNTYLRPVKKNQLEPLFGNITFDKIIPPVMAKLELKASFKNKILTLIAEKASTAPNMKLFLVANYGKGEAVLLNFSLSTAANTCDKSASLDKFLLNLLNSVGITPPVLISNIDKQDAIVRVRSGKDFQLIGLLAEKNDIGKTVNIALPGKVYFYQPGKGYLEYSNKISLQLNQPFKLISYFQQQQHHPEIKLSTVDVTPGNVVALDLNSFSNGTVLLLQIKDPAGKMLMLRNQVITVSGKHKNALIHFAWNDTPGNYTIILENVATGLQSQQILTLMK